MKAEEKIREELKTIMSPNEANACQIGKSQNRWYFVRFGKTPTILERTIADSLAAIREIHEAFEE